MSLDLILEGAAGGVVGAVAALATQAATAAFAKVHRTTNATGVHSEPSLFAPHVEPHAEWHSAGSATSEATPATEPAATAAHARLRERQLAEFADELAGDDPVLRERLRRFEGGLS